MVPSRCGRRPRFVPAPGSGEPHGEKDARHAQLGRDPAHAAGDGGRVSSAGGFARRCAARPCPAARLGIGARSRSVPGMAWLPVAPPHLRRPTPWWVALVAVLGGLLLLGVGMAVGFGLGYVVGDHGSDHSEIGGVPGGGSQGWNGDRQPGRTDDNGVPGGPNGNPGNRDGDSGTPPERQPERQRPRAAVGSDLERCLTARPGAWRRPAASAADPAVAQRLSTVPRRSVKTHPSGARATSRPRRCTTSWWW